LHEELRISTAGGALDLRRTVGFFASAESVMRLDKENSESPYFSFPLRAGSDIVIVQPRRLDPVNL
jgi:hypothetical protein